MTISVISMNYTSRAIDENRHHICNLYRSRSDMSLWNLHVWKIRRAHCSRRTTASASLVALLLLLGGVESNSGPVRTLPANTGFSIGLLNARSAVKLDVAPSSYQVIHQHCGEMQRLLDIHVPLTTCTRRVGRHDCRWLSAAAQDAKRR